MPKIKITEKQLDVIISCLTKIVNKQEENLCTTIALADSLSSLSQEIITALFEHMEQAIRVRNLLILFWEHHEDYNTAYEQICGLKASVAGINQARSSIINNHDIDLISR